MGILLQYLRPPAEELGGTFLVIAGFTLLLIAISAFYLRGRRQGGEEVLVANPFPNLLFLAGHLTVF
ncbi:MAG: hypothetical protein QI197_04560 [Candidatus Korarchaeota archaeon]|nr:hypothetical protein [Candidatus Korarchaeota archaeon]